jgi:hypothetical protein
MQRLEPAQRTRISGARGFQERARLLALVLEIQAPRAPVLSWDG